MELRNKISFDVFRIGSFMAIKINLFVNSRRENGWSQILNRNFNLKILLNYRTLKSDSIFFFQIRLNERLHVVR